MADSFARTAFTITGALLAWAADFVLVYAFAAVACERGYASRTVAGVGIVPLVSIVASMLAAGVTIWLLRAAAHKTPAPTREQNSSGRNGAFTSRTTRVVGALALIAIVLTALPAVLVSAACA
jgi:hypothetical protein